MRNVVAVKRVSKNRKENLPPEVSFKSHIKLFFFYFLVSSCIIHSRRGANSSITKRATTYLTGDLFTKLILEISCLLLAGRRPANSVRSANWRIVVTFCHFFRQYKESNNKVLQCLTSKRANFSIHSTPKFQIHFSLDWMNRFSKFQRWLVHLTL